MSVSLVVLPSQYAHTKLQKKILQGIYPNYDHRLKTAKGAGQKRPDIHFTDLKNELRYAAASILRDEKDISAITCVHYHDGYKNHEERHALYISMVESVVTSAIDRYEDLELFIAFISAFKGQTSYQEPLRQRLEKIRSEFSRRRGFRKLKIYFPTAKMPGVQIADFYAGALREHCLSQRSEEEKSGAFKLIEHHYVQQNYA
ncbi:MAG: hypothetical protein K2X81_19235 [Candidatus Obscuribacterales bacterium]|nr:hypothetical protein [Candidatus Obscuribacterales bacterium]